MSLCSHHMWTMQPEYHCGQQGISFEKTCSRGEIRCPLRCRKHLKEALYIIISNLKMKFSLCVTKPSGVGMQFLVLEFLSSAQLDHTSMYNFENCSWVQGFLYLSHMYDNFYFFKNIIFKYINLLNFGKLPFNLLLLPRLQLVQT